VAEEIKGLGSDALIIKSDLLDAEAGQRIVKAVFEGFKTDGIDILGLLRTQ
jgi:hypothetical protein